MRRSAITSAILGLALTGTVLAQPPRPHASADSLPLANGAATAVFSVARGRVVDFFNHPYKKYNAGEVTADLCFEASWQAAAAETPPVLEYLEGTGILHSRQSDPTRVVDRYLFLPMEGASDGYPDRQLVMLLRVENRTGRPEPIAALARLDFRVGGGHRPDPNDKSDQVDHQWRGVAGETITPEDQGWLESATGESHRLFYRPMGEWKARVVQEEGAVLELSSTGQVAPGQARWLGLLIGYGEGASNVSRQAEAYLAGSTPEDLLERERGFWRDYHLVEPDLSHLSPSRQAVYRQSTAFLKMGQVRERGRPLSEGQILASVKDKWARCWVRDASYAIVGLALSGHRQEAQSGLEFLLRSRKEPGHDYLAMINGTLPASRKLDDYLLSVCRYWGDGSEESDWNAAGPNIEFDNWGLFLWAVAETLDAMPAEGRDAFLKRHRATIDGGVAKPLLRLIGDNGLIAADSSIWEHHWSLPLAYDGRRHYTYTSLAASNGLRRWAPWSAQRIACREGAERIRRGVIESLSHPEGGLGSSLEDLATDPAQAYDAAVMEAVNWDILPQEQVMTSLSKALSSLTPGSPGFRRNDDGNWYDQQEWLLLDLRGAAAWRKLGQPARSDALLDWVTGWAAANYNTLGELLDEKGDFQGPFPMTGFGPGAYILATPPAGR